MWTCFLSCILSSLWIKPEWKAIDINCANKITLRGGCSSRNLPAPCCYGYSSRSPSENGSASSSESGKPSSGGRSPETVMAQQKVAKEEARKRNGEAPPLPSTTPGPSHTCMCAHSPTSVYFNSQFFCRTPKDRESPAYLSLYHLTLCPELFCLMPSAPCSYGIVQCLRKTL